MIIHLPSVQFLHFQRHTADVKTHDMPATSMRSDEQASNDMSLQMCSGAAMQILCVWLAWQFQNE